MGIPSNKVLAGLGLIGAVVTAWSTYWIGKRNELNQMIDLGKNVEENLDFFALDVFDKKGYPVSLYVRTEKR